MDERLRFVARLLEGEPMAALCREFDISRTTGYKIFQRCKDCGLAGRTDRSRRPYRQANQPPLQVMRRTFAEPATAPVLRSRSQAATRSRIRPPLPATPAVR